jgi:hypothetical protein
LRARRTDYTTEARLKPFGAQQRCQQINEEQNGHDACQDNHRDLSNPWDGPLSSVSLHALATGCEGKHESHCRNSSRKQCWKPDHQIHLEETSAGGARPGSAQ